MKVQDILTTKNPQVLTATPDQTVSDASQVLAEYKIGALVVVNKSRNPVGIISERDIVRVLAYHQAAALSLKVGDVMTKDLIVATSEDELEHLSRVMTHKRIRHLPVMKDDELIGMVSIGDIVKAQMDNFEGEAINLRHYITGSYV